MATQILLAYSDDAKSRAAQKGAAELTAVFESLPGPMLTKALNRLRPIPGFRKDSTPELKERLKKVITALSRGADKKTKPNEREWDALGWVWWTKACKALGPESVLPPDEINNLGENGGVQFLTEALSHAGDEGFSRETIERVMELSPFTKTPELNSYIASLETEATLERTREIKKLPSKVNKISEQLSSLEQRLGELNDNQVSVKQQSEIESLKNNFEELSALVRQFSGKELICADDLSGIQHQLAIAVETSEINKAAISQAQDEILLLKESAEKSLSVKAPLELSSSQAPKEQTGAPVALLTQAQPEFRVVSGESVHEVSDAKALLGLLENNYTAIGVATADAASISKVVIAALATGQLLQFRGSFGSFIADATTMAVDGGKVLALDVPLGLDNVIAGKDLLRLVNEDESIGCVRLDGINKSAFEIFGDPIRSLLVRRIMGSERDSLVPFIAVHNEGMAVLPGGQNLTELGPVIHTDALVWERARLSKLRRGRCSGPIGKMLGSLSISQTGSDFVEFFSELKPRPSAMALRSVKRALAALHVIPGFEEGDDAALCLAAWLIPHLYAGNIASREVEQIVLQNADWTESQLVKRVLNVGSDESLQ